MWVLTLLPPLRLCQASLDESHRAASPEARPGTEKNVLYRQSQSKLPPLKNNVQPITENANSALPFNILINTTYYRLYIVSYSFLWSGSAQSCNWSGQTDRPMTFALPVEYEVHLEIQILVIVLEDARDRGSQKE